MNAEQLNAEASKHFDRAHESFERCDTDGFLSQWASNLSGQKCREQAKIVENGGLWTFAGLFDAKTGERIPAKIIRTQYGQCWAVCDDAGQFTGKFIPTFKGCEPDAYTYPDAKEFAKQEKKYKAQLARYIAKHGAEERDELAPAKADIVGHGRGLAGASTCYVTILRTDGGYPGARQ